jgi:hypothetical protein
MSKETEIKINKTRTSFTIIKQERGGWFYKTIENTFSPDSCLTAFLLKVFSDIDLSLK